MFTFKIKDVTNLNTIQRDQEKKKHQEKNH